MFILKPFFCTRLIQTAYQLHTLTPQQKVLYDNASLACGKVMTQTYSTSFSLAVRLLHKDLRDPVHSIYGFVRLADEIVDSFHDAPKRELLERLRNDTYRAIEEGICLNPLLNGFQQTVNRYGIDHGLIDTFLHSMEMDLDRKTYDRAGYETYILGSAEVVGLMCLKVFCEGNDALYEELKAPAMRLGAAFQKINFLRDLGTDHLKLGRSYFPDLDPHNFNDEAKKRIEAEILADFEAGLEGIIRLPRKARFGVYVAYVYYMALFKKIAGLGAAHMLQARVRVSNGRKASLLVRSYVQHRLDLI